VLCCGCCVELVLGVVRRSVLKLEDLLCTKVPLRINEGLGRLAWLTSRMQSVGEIFSCLTLISLTFLVSRFVATYGLLTMTIVKIS
jgi:hypothetical protein